MEVVCGLRTEEDLERLDENVKLQRFHLEQGNYSGIMELDNRFHEMLFEIAQKPQAYAMIQHIAIHFDRVRSMALSSVKDIKIVEDHAKIVEALRNRDAAEARAVMDKHLNRYKFDEQAVRETYPMYFAPKEG